ncbi:uncharacterized protein LOC127862318 isoform X1 [Dreissena polymorpha]|nr:uncharacterized protein LOC127862318 isoform X1 [Dreissena polymorpha]XP_052257355.1 uncharacterized protein LOC127862318 isoform X1 [Dreissena polymorpha]
MFGGRFNRSLMVVLFVALGVVLVYLSNLTLRDMHLPFSTGNDMPLSSSAAHLRMQSVKDSSVRIATPSYSSQNDIPAVNGENLQLEEYQVTTPSSTTSSVSLTYVLFSYYGSMHSSETTSREPAYNSVYGEGRKAGDIQETGICQHSDMNKIKKNPEINNIHIGSFPSKQDSGEEANFILADPFEQYDETQPELSTPAYLETMSISVSKADSASQQTTDAILQNVTRKPTTDGPRSTQSTRWWKGIHVFDWKRAPVPSRTFECVPMQTLTSYIRLCIHPLYKDPLISGYIQSRGFWEFEAIRDVQLAVVGEKGRGLIDIGAGIGTYSLAVASLNYTVVAVEPLSTHVQLFHQSVRMNKFEDNIKLLKNAVFNKQEIIFVNSKENDINDIEIKPFTDDQNSSEFKADNMLSTITLNDLNSVCTFKTAVLKLDVPRYNRLALESSDKLFDAINITHVFHHWEPENKPLCTFYLDFFLSKGYKPMSELIGGHFLNLAKNDTWEESVIIWTKI